MILNGHYALCYGNRPVLWLHGTSWGLATVLSVNVEACIVCVICRVSRLELQTRAHFIASFNSTTWLPCSLRRPPWEPFAERFRSSTCFKRNSHYGRTTAFMFTFFSFFRVLVLIIILYFSPFQFFSYFSCLYFSHFLNFVIFTFNTISILSISHFIFLLNVSVLFSLCARLNWQFVCQFLSANFPLYCIVVYCKRV